MKLEEITVVEAISEETASTKRVQVERQPAKGGWELGSLARLRGDFHLRDGLRDRTTMT